MKIKALLFVFFIAAAFCSAENKVIHLNLDGTVHPITAEYVTNAIDLAVQSHAQLVVLQIQTPGGLSESMRTIISKMINSPVPVVVYVAPGGSRATSAGFYIAIAADVAVMAPGTHLGSAHPVFGTDSGEDNENTKTMMTKATEDSVAYIKTLAEHRGRNVEQAEKAVRDSISFTENEALEKHLIDFIAPDIKELLKKLDGQSIKRFNGGTTTVASKDAKIIPFEMTRREKFLALLADPNIAFILVSLGTLGLMIELYNPGSILPGIVGVISLVLFFFSMQILPISYSGAGLILFAIALFILELKVHSHGLLTAGGICSLALGATMLINAPIPEMRVAPGLIILVVGIIATTMIFLLTMVIRAYRRKPVTGVQGLLQEIGTAETDIAPEGRIFVHGEIWQAVSPVLIHKGEKVRILAADGLLLKVEKYDTR